MDASNLLLAGLVVVVLLWAGLSIWRDAALKRWQKIERSYITYYASKQGEAPGFVPPVKWDFEKKRLVEIPPGEYTVEEHEATKPRQPSTISVLVKDTGRPFPFWMWGAVLGQLSAVWFHGVFAGLTLLLGLSATKWHA